MTIETVTINGTDVTYRDSGGDEPVIIFSSGIGQSKEFWSPQFDALADKHRLIAWDYPNHGETGLTGKTETAPTYANYLRALMDVLNIPKATLVGNSLGGAVSIHCYDQAPERVEAMVLVAPALLGKEVFFPFRLMTLPILGKVMTKPSDKAVDMQLGGVFHDKNKIPDAIKAAVKRNTYKDGGPGAFLATMKATLGLSGVHAPVFETQHAILKRVSCPVLFVHGHDDQILPFKHTQAAAAMVAGARLELLDHCGHAPQLEKPNEFNALMEGFMRA